MKYYLRLPEKLTIDQQLALDEPESIALFGGPGTGKTLVNLWRHIYNYERGNKKSLLLTYTKTLEYYLREHCAERENKDSSLHINRTKKWNYSGSDKYDEIIIDEAQDVNIEWYKYIQQYTNRVSYGADPDQSLYLSKEDTRTVLAELKTLFPNQEITLYKNFRNSKEILLFTQALFPDICIEQEAVEQAESHNLPFVSTVGRNERIIALKVNEIIQTYKSETTNIGILLPSKNLVSRFYSHLVDMGNICSWYYSQDNDITGIENIHLTTFKSAKGIEFDTVIIPKFDSYRWYISQGYATMNDYYVALTRAKTNLFLVCSDYLPLPAGIYQTE